MCLGGTDNTAKKMRKEEKAKQAAIAEGMAAIDRLYGGLGQSFFDAKKKAYENYNLPQLAQQFGDTQRQVGFRLADQGLMKSSAGSSLAGSLMRELNKQRQGVADTAQQTAQQLRSQVEGERSNMVAQLNASGDVASATNQALSSVANFRAPSTVAPIGQVFNDWANIYLTRKNQQIYQGASDQLKQSTSPSTSTVRYLG